MTDPTQAACRRLFFAVMLNDLEALTALLRQGADPNFAQEYWPNTACSEWLTPLHAAVLAGSLPAIEALLAHDADANAVSNRQRTPLDLVGRGPSWQRLRAAGALGRWELMTSRRVIGVAMAAATAAAPVPRPLVMVDLADGTCRLLDVSLGQAANAVPLSAPYELDWERGVTWPASGSRNAYRDVLLEITGEVWSLRVDGEHPADGNLPVELAWVRGPEGFADGVFFPSRAEQRRAADGKGTAQPG